MFYNRGILSYVTDNKGPTMTQHSWLFVCEMIALQLLLSEWIQKLKKSSLVFVHHLPKTQQERHFHHSFDIGFFFISVFWNTLSEIHLDKEA